MVAGYIVAAGTPAKDKGI